MNLEAFRTLGSLPGDLTLVPLRGQGSLKMETAFAKRPGSPGMHGTSAVDHHPPLCAFLHRTASAQLFSTETCLT